MSEIRKAKSELLISLGCAVFVALGILASLGSAIVWLEPLWKR